MCFEEWTGVGFSGSTRTLWRKGVGEREWADGFSPWNFNQRQLLAGVARSPYVRTFLETQRQNSILPSFSPLSLSFLPRVDLAARIPSSSVVARRGGNRQVLPRDARRLILSPKTHHFPASPPLLLLLLLLLFLVKMCKAEIAASQRYIRFDSRLPRCNLVIVLLLGVTVRNFKLI